MNVACDESTHTANRMGIIDLQMSIFFLVPGHQTFPRLTDQPRSRGTKSFFRVSERLRINVASQGSQAPRRGRLLILWLPGYQPDLPLQKRPFVLVHSALDAVMRLATDRRKQPDNDVGTGRNSGEGEITVSPDL
jgi:hypothetical protein